MSSKFKGFLKKFVPSSAKTNKHYADTVLSELKSLHARFDEQFKKDKSLLEKIDESAKALGEQLCAKDEKLHQKLDIVTQSTKSLGDKLDENSITTDNKISAFGEQIVQELSAVKQNTISTSEQISSDTEKINEKLDESINYARNNITELNEKISQNDLKTNEKLDAINQNTEKLSSQIASKEKELAQLINSNNDSLSDKLNFLGQETELLKARINDSSKKLFEKIEILDKDAQALNNQIDNNNTKLLEELELLKQQAVAVDKLMNDRLDYIEKSVSDVNLISTNILDSAIKIKETAEATSNKNDELEKAIAVSAEEILKLQAELEQKALEKLTAVYQKTQDTVRNSAEAVYAHVFNNVITKSNWLKDKNFAPGRWAVGYPYLYVMYQVLNIAKPKSILDLGLGQTTKMLTQYAAANDDVEHIVLENDPDWIKVFKRKNKVSERTKIILSDIEFIKYKSDDSVRVYSSFNEAVKGKKFDFISIDGPLGGDMKKYSRIDILSVIPECLANDFVIMMHDMERQMEANTLVELQFLLKQASIKYRCGRYNGQKDTILICSEQPGYLTSL